MTIRWSLMLMSGIVLVSIARTEGQVPVPVASYSQRLTEARINPEDGLRYVYIGPGSAQLGCVSDSVDCLLLGSPNHTVKIQEGFWIGQTEVTQAAYARVTGNQSQKTELQPELPIDAVALEEAELYCRSIDGRLPSDDEWEYAGRAGASDPNDADLDAIAWFSDNSRDRVQKVAQKQPNLWGLYDMLGNVWEWIARNEEPVISPKRFVRGGSAYNDAWGLRYSTRFPVDASTRTAGLGFRCIWQPPQP